MKDHADKSKNTKGIPAAAGPGHSSPDKSNGDLQTESRQLARPLALGPRELNEITGQWDYTLLPANVRIGRNCFLERKESFKRFRSIRQPGLVLGDRVRAYTWTEFNIEPDAWVEVGQDSVLVGAVFMCAEHIRIGRNVAVSYNVTIADSDFHPLDPEQRMQDAIANAPFGNKSLRPPIMSRPVIIEDEARIGIGAIILKGVRIGVGAEVDAGAVVTKDVAAGTRVSGNPAKIPLATSK